MGTSRQLSGPLHEQVRRDLYERVRAGEFLPRSAIPNEERLCAEYGVSRITIRRAIGDLCAENVLLRRHGVGTFVADPAAAMQSVRLRGQLGDALAYDKRVRFKFRERIEGCKEVRPEIAASLGAGTRPTCVRCIVEVKGEVFAAVDFYLAADDALRMRRIDFSTHEQPIVRIAERLDRPLWRAHQTMVAAAADARVATVLNLAEGGPVMEVVRTYFDADERAIAVIVALCHPERYRVEVEFQSFGASSASTRIKRRKTFPSSR